MDHLHLPLKTAAAGQRWSTGGARSAGSARTLLECERVSLNFLQRLSGIATLARSYADAVAGTECKVLDTRKTTPGLRRLEKMAAAAGGVTNHRMGLYDAVLIKNNHIAAAGGVRARDGAGEGFDAARRDRSADAGGTAKRRWNAGRSICCWII